MKRFALLLLAAAALTGCKTGNDEQTACPVTGIVLPAADASKPVQPGTTVTIAGSGFNDSSEILLRGNAATVEATVTEVTASALSFTAPTVFGLQTVVLRQDGGSWEIGELTFPQPEDVPLELLSRRVARIRVTITDDMTYLLHFDYDEKGRIAALRETDRQYLYAGADPNRTPEEDRTTIAYADDGIEITDSRTVTTIELTDGKATALTSRAIGADYADFYTYTYDGKGYLSRSAWRSTEPVEPASIVYRVVDGTLAEYTETREGSSERTTFENDPAQPNNLNVDLFGIEVFIGSGFKRIKLLNVGGERFRTLPAAVTEQENPTAETKRYRYTMEGDYISKVEIYSQVGHDPTLDTRLEFFYAE